MMEAFFGVLLPLLIFAAGAVGGANVAWGLEKRRKKRLQVADWTPSAQHVATLADRDCEMVELGARREIETKVPPGFYAPVDGGDRVIEVKRETRLIRVEQLRFKFDAIKEDLDWFLVGWRIPTEDEAGRGAVDELSVPRH